VTPAKPDNNLAFVIDDDPAAQQFVCGALTEQGIEATGFATAPTALAAFDERTPRLIFLDVALSQSDAIDVLNGLGQRRYRGVVHLMSGGRPQLIAGVQRLGERQGVRFGQAIGKPVSREAILQAAAMSDPREDGAP
jgi:DNA-binding NtrC family response regulator